ncbi:hypothetical protein KSP40_PGU009675 [Platanthera guangdongensis]|uniref:START domain-containing protein n=1 Tax=Platanthera guangdongensis TaxID=2320717 RepID=A0ABR2MTY7_9ASPA
MAKYNFFQSNLRGIAFDSSEFWREDGGGGRATAAAVLLILFWQFLRAFRKRLAATPTPVVLSAKAAPACLPIDTTSTRISSIVTDGDLKDLITNLDCKNNEREKWEEVIAKKNDRLTYHAKCCRPKDAPLKYLSVTIFDKCSTELLRNFYMDSQYRKNWDKTLLDFEQLQVNETSGTEVGRMVKKFPLLTPREYIMAWRVWEGKDKTFYCFTKDCEHPLAPRQKKFVRVGFLRSGWRIRKVPGTNACEIAMIHQEDAGLNVEMARLAFSKGIWSYMCKMNDALQEYSTCSHTSSPSPSVASMNKLIRKVPAFIESDVGTTDASTNEISSAGEFDSPAAGNLPSGVKLKISSKWITNGLLLIGGIACLSRARSTLGAQIAVACIAKKLFKRGSSTSEQSESVRVRSSDKAVKVK